MSTELQMSFAVEPSLLEAFDEVVRRNGQTAEQVLQDFVRRYVREHAAPTALPSITAEERSRRESAVRAARASVVLSGFKVSPEDEDRARRFIDGETDLDDYLNRHD